MKDYKLVLVWLTVAFICTLLFILPYPYAAAQTPQNEVRIRPSVMQLVKAIAKVNAIDSAAVTTWGKKPAQWSPFKKLCTT